MLRDTLKGLEINYPIRILSNQINLINKRLYTTKVQQTNIDPCGFAETSKNVDTSVNPSALTGFIHGEGSFMIGISRNQNKVGWQVKLEFWLSLHEADIVLLQNIQKYLGVGNIFKDKSNKIYHYRIASTKDLIKIFDHLDQYPLITQKLADYKLFKQGYNLVINKEHLTLSGLYKIVALKASMNLGLSDHLKTAFPNVIPEARPLVVNKIIADPQWLAGFASAEGCFFFRYS